MPVGAAVLFLQTIVFSYESKRSRWPGLCIASFARGPRAIRRGANVPRVASETSVSAQVAASTARHAGQANRSGAEPFAGLLPQAEAPPPARRDSSQSGKPADKAAAKDAPRRTHDDSGRHEAVATKTGGDPETKDEPVADSDTARGARPESEATSALTIEVAAPSPETESDSDADAGAAPDAAQSGDAATPAMVTGVAVTGAPTPGAATIESAHSLSPLQALLSTGNAETPERAATADEAAAPDQAGTAEGQGKLPKLAVGPQPAPPELAKTKQHDNPSLTPLTMPAAEAHGATGTAASLPDTTGLAVQPAPASHHAAPAAAPAPTAPAPVPVAGLAVSIAANAGAGRNRFEIRLDPPELGRIDVRLHFDAHGHVTSHLIVDRSETLDLLRRDAAQLDQALQQAGLKTSDNGLQFSLRDQSSGPFSDGRDHAPAAAQMIIPDSDTPAEVAARGYLRAGQGAGLDIRV
jgi:flagellar hook-length control protein FliK